MKPPPIDLRRAESRLRAVEAVDGVVHAIWALSRAQLAQVEQLAAEQSTYLDWVQAVTERLVGSAPAADAGDALHVVIGPERSFCGGLPRQVLDAVPAQGRLGIVGHRFAEAVAAAPAVSRRVVFRVAGPASVHDLLEASEAVAEQLLPHAGGAGVELWYPTTHTRALIHGSVLLTAGGTPPVPDYETLTPAPALIQHALAELVIGRVRVGLSEALRVESKARAAAAEQARQAVDRQAETLQTAMRVLQQETITNELCELVAGRLQP